MSFADKVNRFNRELVYNGDPLPKGIRIMNPFRDNDYALQVSEVFYKKYFGDNNPRHIILGINPGRFGAGLTGIPFTDPKRLITECGISYPGKLAHELSSVFIYDMIAAYGGSESFYHDFFINSPCPLGFTSVSDNGKEKNYNYYDSKALLDAVEGFMIESLQKLIDLGIKTDTCFCFGTGKNYRFLNMLNESYHFFENIHPLEHPRYIMQYKLAQKQFYIDKYLRAFSSVRTH